MRVTQVAIRPTEASEEAARPALTPELLAASGARYSRNNEGLESILSKIDPDDLDKSVDSIFRLIDYGHQSIADMAPAAIFIDDVSMLLAYLIWSWCPTAGGQESSTRYIKLNRDDLVDPDVFGLPPKRHAHWYDFMDKCFDAYGQALSFWDRIGQDHPDLTRIPRALLIDPSEKAQKQVARMRRNYAFDRARYFLPVATRTNMMLIMSARGWVQLCQNLLSHWLPEANLLGTQIKEELGLSAPRMVKHAEPKPSFQSGHQDELQRFGKFIRSHKEASRDAPCIANIELFPPHGVSEQDLVDALKWHDNRYAFIGSAACRTSVRFSWTAVALAEIRDLNRHRTGQKYCPLTPVGFYCAADQVPEKGSFDGSLPLLGDYSVRVSRSWIKQGTSDFVAWFLLGSQFMFEHTTTLDKFIYEAELRTGAGAHYRYATHLRQSIQALAETLPTLAGVIRLGTFEPE